jgi:hypothetical protein
MAKDGIDAVETSDGIARREFRSKHAAGNEAVAPHPRQTPRRKIDDSLNREL